MRPRLLVPRWRSQRRRICGAGRDGSFAKLLYGDSHFGTWTKIELCVRQVADDLEATTFNVHGHCLNASRIPARGPVDYPVDDGNFSFRSIRRHFEQHQRLVFFRFLVLATLMEGSLVRPRFLVTRSRWGLSMGVPVVRVDSSSSGRSSVSFDTSPMTGAAG